MKIVLYVYTYLLTFLIKATPICFYLEYYWKTITISYLFFQLHNQAETERHVKSKTKQNLELSAKNKELTQSLKQLHQSFLASNQVRVYRAKILICRYDWLYSSSSMEDKAVVSSFSPDLWLSNIFFYAHYCAVYDLLG